jgi:hypothetical protein
MNLHHVDTAPAKNICLSSHHNQEGRNSGSPSQTCILKLQSIERWEIFIDARAWYLVGEIETHEDKGESKEW